MAMWVVPLGADWHTERVHLPRGRTFVRHTPGKAGQRVCLRASAVVQQLAGARICLVTSNRARDNLNAQEVMREFLITRARCPAAKIELASLHDVPFTTSGEMEILATVIREDALVANTISVAEKDVVYLVGRWWHIPRAKALLRKRLGRLHTRVTITSVAVPSWELFWILREFFLAWPKNFLLGRL